MALYSYGLHSYGLDRYGLSSYGLSSYGLHSHYHWTRRDRIGSGHDWLLTRPY